MSLINSNLKIEAIITGIIAVIGIFYLALSNKQISKIETMSEYFDRTHEDNSETNHGSCGDNI